MKPAMIPKVAFTLTMEEDGAINCGYTVTDSFGLMQWDGVQWDEASQRHIPSLTPMYSDLTLLSNPDLPDSEAEAIMRRFFDYIISTRREATKAAQEMRRKSIR